MTELQALRSGARAGARRLDLSADLSELPAEVFDLADTLEVLNLSGNRLRTLPAGMARLRRLKVLFCSDNLFEELPAVLGACPQLEMIGFKACRIRHVPAEALPPRLRWLILTDNRIEQLPDSLGRCTRIQKLMLAGNQLRTLPDLSGCEQLELLRLSANRFDELPASLLQLPRLSWLGLAGNALPGLLAPPPPPTLAPIAWSALTLQERLGAGASGVIHRALWQRPDQPQQPAQPVALKLFHSAMTSDGLPDSELQACLAAAGHAGLIPVEGVLQQHPEGRLGLVLALLDPAFRALAGPPSLDSCSRDVYAAPLQLPLAAALALARQVAAIAAHLHARGLLHGDLYGHNLLWNGDRQAPQALLSDFGAATIYQPEAPAAAALQRIEVRAFGCLLEELIEQSLPAGSSEAAALRSGLIRLRDACLQPQVAKRPDFASLAQQLAALSAPAA
ncbi:MAG: hypothetical protein RJA44_266 [Pseudomonadota bacterium]